MRWDEMGWDEMSCYIYEKKKILKLKTQNSKRKEEEKKKTKMEQQLIIYIYIYLLKFNNYLFLLDQVFFVFFV